MRDRVRVSVARAARARPVGIDPTPTQLAIARTQQRETGLSFPLVRAAGEAVPMKSGAFDVVISEYGAAIWADPYRWIPEAGAPAPARGRVDLPREQHASDAVCA